MNTIYNTTTVYPHSYSDPYFIIFPTISKVKTGEFCFVWDLLKSVELAGVKSETHRPAFFIALIFILISESEHAELVPEQQLQPAGYTDVKDYSVLLYSALEMITIMANRTPPLIDCGNPLLSTRFLQETWDRFVHRLQSRSIGRHMDDSLTLASLHPFNCPLCIFSSSCLSVHPACQVQCIHIANKWVLVIWLWVQGGSMRTI